MKRMFSIATLISLGFSGAAHAENQPMSVVYDGAFPRLDFTTVMPTGQSVAVECQDQNANYPYTPYDWPDAQAQLTIKQGGSISQVIVAVENAKPETLYTMWVRLRGTDADGDTFGGNPLIGLPTNPDVGIPGNALVPSDYMPRALAAVHSPVRDPLHGFMSDASGNGSVTIDLDYPIVGGAVPFQKFPGFDSSDDQLTRNDAQAIPVAIVGELSNAPFTLRLASHCVDGLSHGLAPGPHEGWFDWVSGGQ